MKTWDDYKNHVSAVDPEIAKDIKESEEIAAIVSAMIEQSVESINSTYLNPSNSTLPNPANLTYARTSCPV